MQRAREKGRFERGEDLVRFHVAPLENPVRAGVEGDHFLLGIAGLVRGHHDDKEALEFVVAANVAQEVQAIDIGRLEIDEERVEGEAVQDVQALGPVTDGFHAVAGTFHLFAPAPHRAVLGGNDEDALGTGQPLATGRTFHRRDHGDLAGGSRSGRGGKRRGIWRSGPASKETAEESTARAVVGIAHNFACVRKGAVAGKCSGG